MKEEKKPNSDLHRERYEFARTMSVYRDSRFFFSVDNQTKPGPRIGEDMGSAPIVTGIVIPWL